MKKRTVLTSIFAFVVIVAIAIGFFALKQKEKRENELEQENKSVYTLADEEYNKIAQTLDFKLYESGIDGVFYSLSPVKYFSVKGGSVTELTPAGKMKVSPVVGTCKMEFEIDFIKTENDVFGVGVWHSDSGVYNDAFAVLKRASGQLSSREYLLLIDTNAGEKSASERTFSEIFAVSKSGSECSYIFDRSNITVEESGKLRTDWDVVKLGCLNASFKGGVPVLTGRKNNRDRTNQKYDLRTFKNGSKTSVATAVSDAFIGVSADRLTYIRQNKANWELLSSDGKKEKKIASFEGIIGSDYSVFGTLAVNKTDKSLISLNDGKSYDALKDFKAVYSVGENSKRIILVGKEENRDGEDYKVQKIVLLAKADGKTLTLYANDIMDENTSLITCSEGIITLKNGKSVFISYSDIETIGAGVVK